MTTRNEIAKLLLDMIRPLRPFYSSGGAWLHVGNTAAHYGEKAARMEGYARVLWGLGPLWVQDNSSLPEELQKESQEWLLLYRNGLIHGTDPGHEEYWGEVLDFDQKMVEMAALSVAISLSPDKFWTPLTEVQKKNLYQWMFQINEKKVHPNNWRFFRILVNMMFRILGLPWSEEAEKDDWEIIESCYTQNGWYYDGKPEQVDYYIPFAMEFYGLIYARFAKEWDKERAEILRKRGAEFSKTFVYWFGEDGNEVPFGRSLTYRFAHSAFFSAMAFADEPGVGYGIMKALAVRNLNIWMKRPIFDPAGILTIGYGYPNLLMSEKYNAPGSPYWSFKAFLMLALPEDHRFWTAEEEVFSYEEQKLLNEPHMIVTHERNNHVMFFVAGQHSMNHGCVSAKYEKFVYSNQFGFSIPRGSDLNDGAFDSILAVSEAGEKHYRVQEGVERYKVTERAVYRKYLIGSLAEIVSILIPCGPWHLRVHKVSAKRKIDLADGGFAIKSEPCFEVVSGIKNGKYTSDMIRETENAVFADMPWGLSGIVSRTGGTAQVITAFPNTNLFYNLTVIPMITKTLEAGDHLLITAVLGIPGAERKPEELTVPAVTINQGTIRVLWNDRKIIVDEEF